MILDWQHAATSPSSPLSLSDMPASVATHRDCALALSPEDWGWVGSLPLFLHFPDINVVAVHGGVVPTGNSLWQTAPRSVINVRSVGLTAAATARARGGSEGGKQGSDSESDSGDADSVDVVGDLGASLYEAKRKGGALWASVYSGVEVPVQKDMKALLNNISNQHTQSDNAAKNNGCKSARVGDESEGRVILTALLSKLRSAANGASDREHGGHGPDSSMNDSHGRSDRGHAESYVIPEAPPHWTGYSDADNTPLDEASSDAAGHLDEYLSVFKRSAISLLVSVPLLPTPLLSNTSKGSDKAAGNNNNAGSDTDAMLSFAVPTAEKPSSSLMTGTISGILATLHPVPVPEKVAVSSTTIPAPELPESSSETPVDNSAHASSSGSSNSKIGRAHV